MCLKTRQEASSHDSLLSLNLVGVRGFEPLPFVLYRSFEYSAFAICAHRPSTFVEGSGGVAGVAV